MKKLFTSMFITLFLFEMLCRFSAIPWVFEPPFSQIGSLRSVEKEIDESKSIDYVFFGNSLIRDAVSPLLLDKNNNFGTFSLNLGVSAGSTFVDYKLLTSIENSPKKIFIQADLPRFSLNFTESFYFKKLSTFEDWLDINKNNFNLSSSPSKLLSSIDIWHRLIFYRDGTTEIGETLKKDYLGQFDVYSDEVSLNQGVFNESIYNGGWINKVNKDSLYFFHKICEYSKINEIQIVLIHLPLNSENLAMKELVINDYLKYIKNECVADTQIFNYVNELSHDSGLFLDYGHLNNAGAEIFTELLIQDISLLSESK